MRIDFLTLFPEMFPGPLGASILGRAAAAGLARFFVHNIRDYSLAKHKNTDDAPFGGGAGMVMTAQPALSCLRAVEAMSPGARRIYMTPRGEPLSQALAEELSLAEGLVLLCGHYEGIDERILTRIDRLVSIGDYILTGGELPALVLADCVLRLTPGVLGSSASAEDESFSDGLLEYPHYTRPAEFQGMRAPDVLLSGNHAEINAWRHEQALRLTAQHRPDLLAGRVFSEAERKLLAELGVEL